MIYAAVGRTQFRWVGGEKNTCRQSLVFVLRYAEKENFSVLDDWGYVSTSLNIGKTPLIYVFKKDPVPICTESMGFRRLFWS